ncbi:amino acid adenylation domain-containing protein [Halotia wernerae UHCC 0503]|nr:amino acid adenylation domain-containing protein [Halotia wernerae UHCC 0503]
MEIDKIEDIYELSPMQQGLLFHTLTAPNSGTYFEQLSCTLQGEFNVAAFRQAWQQVVDRHPILRTAFYWQGLEQPYQVVHCQATLPYEQLDWRDLSAQEQQTQLEELLVSDRQRGFELSQPTLLRLTLIQLTDDTHQFIRSHHHILLDGWSWSILWEEVHLIYQALCQGKDINLAPVLPFRDYITWLQQQNLAGAETFWRQKLKGFTAPTKLMLDQIPNSLPSLGEDFDNQHIFLSQSLTNALQSLARRHQLTLNILIQGVWAVLLSRYSGEQDIVFGATSSGRPPELPGVESIAGLFLNTLPLRVEVLPEASLLNWFKQLQTEQIETRQYEYSALSQIQRWSEILPGLPLFESIVVFNNFPLDQARWKLGESIGSSNYRSFEKTNYPLTFTVVPGSQIKLDIGYDTRRFSAATVARFLEHIQSWLENIVTNPQGRLLDLQPVTDKERYQILQEWNNTTTEYPQDKCIHQLFEAQVEKTPDAIAVVFEEQYLTYSQLNQQANQLAHYLQKLGVRPELLVAICVERSPLMLIGILAILKAGGAYVSLDPDYPQERLGFMLSDAQVPVLLTQESVLAKLPNTQAKVICINNTELIAQRSQNNPVNQSKLENLAYVIYTSGSTGKPKGVMIEHRSLVNYTQAAIEEYEISFSDRILQFASISFDAAAEEIFPCLVQGATLVLRTDEMLNSVPTFLEECQQQSLTVLDLPTAFWQQLTSELPALRLTLPPSLRLVIIGGEKALPDKVSTWQQCVDSKVKLVNSYGPTEATVVATTCDLSAQNFTKEIPIGKAIANIQTYVLDRYLQPVPIGVSGELYIGGTGVARGYLNQPQLTSEKFIPNPFSLKANSRLYKTGDLVRYRSDGNIEIIGRVDHQVKIRGFRIELGEIEAVLSQHPAVQASIVIAEEQRLVAYWVAKQQPLPAISELRHFLGQNLPQYMIPATFLQLATLPLTPNGKVDRKALPAPDYVRSELGKQFIAPRNPIEIKLAHIWAEVLRLEQVGIEDNFFELGGDSILTIQIVAKANQAGLRLTAKQLFQYQNIAELAVVCLTTEETTQAEQEIVTGLVPLTPIQHWFFRQNLPESHHYNQAVLLEVQQAIAPDLLSHSIQHLYIHHDALRLRFEQTESGWQQVIAPPEIEVTLTRFDFSTLPAGEQQPAIEAAATKLQATFDLSSGLLIKVALFDLGTHQPSRLLIIIHHLAVDGVSWRILLEDLQTVYQQFSQGKTVELPAKTTSFKQWSYHLQEYVKSEALAPEQHYWLTLSQKEMFALPIDYLNGENTENSKDIVSIELNVQDTQALLKKVPQAYNTQINDVLLTALGQTFVHWAGNQSLLVELEGHGREEIFDNVNLSRTIGWFTNIFPVHIDLEAALDPGTALKIVKEELRSIPNRGIGYGVMRYLSHDQKITEMLNSIPKAEVLFNYLGQFDQTFSQSSSFKFAQESSGLTLSRRGLRSHLLEINALITNSKLRVDWAYSKNLHRQTTVTSLAEKFKEVLCELIAHCLSPEAGGYTPSDFPDVMLDENQLEKVLAEMGLG